MRKSCIDCVRKHLAQALVLLDETHLGYPHHRWIAVGHLAEAESESIGEWPDFAFKIRECRIGMMRSFDQSKEACIELLLREAIIIAGEDDIEKHEDVLHNSKRFDDIYEPVVRESLEIPF